MAPLLIIFLAVADADGEPARVMLETVAQAFGGDMKVSVERFEGSPPTLEALASAAKARGAAATARVLWRETGGAQVSMDVYVARNDRVAYRGLTFGARDMAAERGRAMGLVLAALILAPEETRSPAVERPPPTVATAAKVATTAAAESPRTTEAVTSSPTGTPEATSVRGGAQAPSPLGAWAVEALAAGGLALGGSGGGLGGAFGVRRLVGERWGARMALQARTGSVSAAQSSSTAAGLAAGLFVTLRPTGPTTPPWNLGARLDAIVGYEMLTHFSADDPSPVDQGRFLPLGAAWLEADWRIAPTAMLHAAMGMEIAAGSTQVLVQDVDVARLSPVRAVAEAGFRLRF